LFPATKRRVYKRNEKKDTHIYLFKFTSGFYLQEVFAFIAADVMNTAIPMEAASRILTATIPAAYFNIFFDNCKMRIWGLCRTRCRSATNRGTTPFKLTQTTAETQSKKMFEPIQLKQYPQIRERETAEGIFISYIMLQIIISNFHMIYFASEVLEKVQR
jgi:hypothetical protein